jgi:hypothetical protein
LLAEPLKKICQPWSQEAVGGGGEKKFQFQEIFRRWAPLAAIKRGRRRERKKAKLMPGLVCTWLAVLNELGLSGREG